MILDEFCETALGAYLESRRDPRGNSHTATPGVAIETAAEARRVADAILAGTPIDGAERVSVAALLRALAGACVEAAAAATPAAQHRPLRA